MSNLRHRYNEVKQFQRGKFLNSAKYFSLHKIFNERDISLFFFYHTYSSSLFVFLLFSISRYFKVKEAALSFSEFIMNENEMLDNEFIVFLKMSIEL